jgi:hypothetical protein
VTALLFILGKGHAQEAHGIAMATVATVISLTDAEKKSFNEAEQKVMLAVKKMTVELKDQRGQRLCFQGRTHQRGAGIKSSVTSEELKQLQDQLKELKLQLKSKGLPPGDQCQAQWRGRKLQIYRRPIKG